jgi:hypothetical protein
MVAALSNGKVDIRVLTVSIVGHIRVPDLGGLMRRMGIHGKLRKLCSLKTYQCWIIGRISIPAYMSGKGILGRTDDYLQKGTQT